MTWTGLELHSGHLPLPSRSCALWTPVRVLLFSTRRSADPCRQLEARASIDTLFPTKPSLHSKVATGGSSAQLHSSEGPTDLGPKACASPQGCPCPQASQGTSLCHQPRADKAGSVALGTGAR